LQDIFISSKSGSSYTIVILKSLYSLKGFFSTVQRLINWSLLFKVEKQSLISAHKNFKALAQLLPEEGGTGT
jgi:hypothetical protein